MFIHQSDPLAPRGGRETPERVFLSRRRWLQLAGLGAGAATVGAGYGLWQSVTSGSDDEVLLAGQWSPEGMPALFECLKRPICDMGFAVVQIDPDTLATREVFRSDGIKGAFGAATTALQFRSSLWIGTVRGDRIMIVPIADRSMR